MSFAAWLSVATICILGAMSPGPSLAVMLRHSVASSQRAGIACALAHGAGIGFYALLTMAGLGFLFQTMPVFRDAVSIAGACYLVWLAIGAWRNAANSSRFDPQKSTGEGHLSDHKGVSGAIRDGLVISCINPKIALFFLALFSQFISADFSWGSKFLLAMTAAVIDGLWYCIVVVGVSYGPILPWLRDHSGIIERILAILFVVIAARVIIGVLPFT